VECSKKSNAEWYAAYAAAQACANAECSRARAVYVIEGLRTRFCVACARIFHNEWYSAWRNTTRCAAAACVRTRATQIYEKERTLFCVECAKTQHATWYAAYRRATRCATTACSNFQQGTLIENVRAEFCVTCSRSGAQLKWYAAYRRATKCRRDECEHQRPTRVFENLRAEFCLNCSRFADAPYYAAYRRAERCNFISLSGVHCTSLALPHSATCTLHSAHYIKAAPRYSKLSCEFMDEYASKMQCSVIHKHYDALSHKLCGEEFLIHGVECTKRGATRVDGYVAATRTIVEFHGDFWHGNPNVYNHNTYNYRTKCSMGELYERTLDRMAELKALDYNVVFVWESEFLAWKAQRNYFAPLPLHSM
jgi:hypothetical protein